MFTGIYGVPIGYFCNIYGKGLSYSCHRVFPAICKYYRVSLQHTQSFPLRSIGLLCDSYSPFPEILQKKLMGTLYNPVNICSVGVIQLICGHIIGFFWPPTNYLLNIFCGFVKCKNRYHKWYKLYKLFDLLNDVATLLESLKNRDYLRISNKKVYYLDKAPMVQSSPKMMSFNGIFLTCSCRFLHPNSLFQLAFEFVQMHWI